MATRRARLVDALPGAASPACALGLDLVFRALAHPARRAIIRQLSEGERNLSELAAPLEMTFSAATKHVRVLEHAKLVRRRVAGRQHFCRLEAAPLKEATQWTESSTLSVSSYLQSIRHEARHHEHYRPLRPANLDSHRHHHRAHPHVQRAPSPGVGSHVHRGQDAPLDAASAGLDLDHLRV
jgi:DNA-binding transcriptional ArsR family regulator